MKNNFKKKTALAAFPLVLAFVIGAVVFPRHNLKTIVLHPIENAQNITAPFNRTIRGATLQVIEIADFNCKHCRDMQKPLQKALEAVGSVSRIFVPYAANRVNTPEGVYARAYLAAEKQRRGMDMKNALFDKMAHHDEGNDPLGRALSTVFRIADSLALDLDSFENSLYAQSTEDMLDTLNTRMRLAAITATPAVIFNGYAVKGALSRRGYEQVIRKILSGKGKS